MGLPLTSLFYFTFLFNMLGTIIVSNITANNKVTKFHGFVVHVRNKI